MGWQKLLMKHGVGSPGYVARRMAKSYRRWKSTGQSVDERAIIRQIFVERVVAQSTLGGPTQYKYLESNPSAIDELIDENPDLFSIVSLAVFIEHPELLGSGAPPDAFDVLRETIQEILDSEAAGWRKQGIWQKQAIICFLCHSKIDDPNPALMLAAFNKNGESEFLCAKCSPPLQIRAMTALAFFLDR